MIGLLGGLVQLGFVSQLTIFGVPADLSPLLVSAAGFYAGSIAGSVFGFSLGVFVDVSLSMTLAASSLVYTAVGYGAGRFRELRGPAETPELRGMDSGLAPAAVGAAASAVALIGFALLQCQAHVEALRAP